MRRRLHVRGGLRRKLVGGLVVGVTTGIITGVKYKII